MEKAWNRSTTVVDRVHANGSRVYEPSLNLDRRPLDRRLILKR
jgi:hypothetical protein